MCPNEQQGNVQNGDGPIAPPDPDPVTDPDRRRIRAGMSTGRRRDICRSGPVRAGEPEGT